MSGTFIRLPGAEPAWWVPTKSLWSRCCHHPWLADGKQRLCCVEHHGRDPCGLAVEAPPRLLQAAFLVWMESRLRGLDRGECWKWLSHTAGSAACYGLEQQPSPTFILPWCSKVVQARHGGWELGGVQDWPCLQANGSPCPPLTAVGREDEMSSGVNHISCA